MRSIGWREYPRNLPTAHLDQWIYDLDLYCQNLSEDADRVFVKDDAETYIQAVQCGQSATTIEGPTQLSQYFESYIQKAQSGCRVILVPQLSSLEPLLISETCMRKLLTHVSAFPPVVDLIHAFGSFDEGIHTGEIYASHGDPDSNVEETCMIFHHGELHGRSEQSNPWSIRQSGIYHRADHGRQEITLMILNPPARVQKRMQNIEQSPSTSDWIMTIFLTSADKNWSCMVDYNETKLDAVNKKIKTNMNFDVHFEDMVVIQNIRHQFCLIRGAISKNKHVLSHLSDDSVQNVQNNRQPRSANITTGRARATARQQYQRLEAMIDRIDNLLVRLDGATSLIASVLDLHATRAAQTSNAKATKMAELGQYSNDLMLRMTKTSVADARTLKTITILTLVYLPASFVSTFLGMGYIRVEQTHPVTLTCRTEMYIFAVLTLCLLLITLGYWGVSEYRQRRRELDGRWHERLQRGSL